MTVKAAAQEKKQQQEQKQQNNHLPVMPSIGQVTVTVTHTVTHAVTHTAMNHSGTTPVTILTSTSVPPPAALLTVNSPRFTSTTITSCHTSSSSPIVSKVRFKVVKRGHSKGDQGVLNYKLIFGSASLRLVLQLEPLENASSNWKTFIDVKNMYFHQDSNPGL